MPFGRRLKVIGCNVPALVYRRFPAVAKASVQDVLGATFFTSHTVLTIRHLFFPGETEQGAMGCLQSSLPQFLTVHGSL